MNKEKLRNTIELIKETYKDRFDFRFEENWDESKELEFLEEFKKVERLKRFEKFSPEKLFTVEKIQQCPNCNEKFTIIEDDIMFIKYGCCNDCYIKNIEGRNKSKHEN